MSDIEKLKAVCCLAGLDDRVTIEELQLLEGLAQRAGIEQHSLRYMIERAHSDESFRQEQIDLAKKDSAAALGTLINIAREDDRLGEGLLMMLLWRIAMNQLDMRADQFDRLVGVKKSSGSA